MKKITLSFLICFSLCIVSSYGQINGPQAVSGQTGTYTINTGGIPGYFIWTLLPGAGTFDNGCSTKVVYGTYSSSVDISWASQCDNLSKHALVTIYRNVYYTNISCNGAYSVPSLITGTAVSSDFGYFIDDCASIDNCVQDQKIIDDAVAGLNGDSQKLIEIFGVDLYAIGLSYNDVLDAVCYTIQGVIGSSNCQSLNDRGINNCN